MTGFDANTRLREILAVASAAEHGTFQDDPDSIRLGHTFLNCSYHADRRMFCARSLEHFDDPRQLKALEGLTRDGSLPELLFANSVFDGIPRVQARLQLYLSAMGHMPAIERELTLAISHATGDQVTRSRWLQFAIGCQLSGDTDPDLLSISVVGGAWMSMTTSAWSDVIKIHGLIDKSDEDVLLDALSASGKDEPASDDDDGPFDPTAPLVQTKLPILANTDRIVVVPPYAPASKSARTDRHKPKLEFQPIAGVALDRVPTGDVGAHMRALVARAPHLSEVYETLLADTGQSKFARFRPTVLVGAPGTGKSWSAREIGKVMGLPVTVFGCGGVADSTFGGTASHWSTSGPSVPLSFVLQSRKANPLIVLDEIEKAASGDNNGRLVDALLTFLDRGNASTYRDPSLEMTVDLSHVSYILTANSLDGIPAPLRDRCRIIRVPNPGREHVPALARHLVADIAADRGIDPRWYPPLAADELEVIADGWGGGSIRQLRRAIEVLLDGRDRIRGIC